MAPAKRSDDAEMSRRRVTTFFPYAANARNEPAFEVQRFARGHVTERFGMHGHRFHEIVVFDTPGGVHRIGDRTLEIASGDIDVIPESTPHDTSGFDGATGWMVLVRPDEMRLAGSDLTSAPVRLHARHRPLTRIRRALEAIAFEARERHPQFAQAMRAHLELVIIELRRLNVGAPVAAPVRNGFIDRLFTTIDANLGDDVRLTDLADALGLTPGHLTTESKRITGRSAMEWVAVRRLDLARRALLETNDTIAAIAARTGFTDAGHLARRFRSEYGTTPARWRAQIRSASASEDRTLAP